ncbi:hypothetical protein [Pollutibacter soli]|uniref:hypothetical protein n=1 Tax=Pollutibacter soli TaxID=3034157 RepID=UPI003013E91A
MKDLANRLQAKQEKYVYYITALSVAAIAFTIVRTEKMAIGVIQIPLAITVVSWSISIVLGLRYLAFQMSTLHTNAGIIKIRTGEGPDTGRDSVKIKIGLNTMTKMFEKQGDQANDHLSGKVGNSI